ncbi:hypothetical protein DPMN_115999 [Dreissena polymorpha]|uniref:Uncharacterized protein n=1 Tax=Dreissena polymorpha TaxID=45954 RepID=A0A9D4QTI4_DREPO|nr:hypothetical protein DPMN_115999 [Dreissena polymorpha]
MAQANFKPTTPFKHMLRSNSSLSKNNTAAEGGCCAAAKFAKQEVELEKRRTQLDTEFAEVVAQQRLVGLKLRVELVQTKLKNIIETDHIDKILHSEVDPTLLKKELEFD